jgi:hypothetical protein
VTMTKVWLVTLLDRGHRVCVEVVGRGRDDACREAHELHPHGQIVHVEPSRDRSAINEGSVKP